MLLKLIPTSLENIYFSFIDSSIYLFMFSVFQVDFAKVLHYIGAGVAFPSSMLFVCLQSALTYRLAKTQEEYRMGHLRVGMTLLALIALVLSILETLTGAAVFQVDSEILLKCFCLCERLM